jgi:hypothetical protein
MRGGRLTHIHSTYSSQCRCVRRSEAQNQSETSREPPNKNNHNNQSLPHLSLVDSILFLWLHGYIFYVCLFSVIAPALSPFYIHTPTPIHTHTHPCHTPIHTDTCVYHLCSCSWSVFILHPLIVATINGCLCVCVCVCVYVSSYMPPTKSAGIASHACSTSA